MNQRHTIILLAILLLNLPFRLYRIDYSEGPIFDEKAYYLEAARSYIQGEIDPNLEHPPLGKLLIALGIATFGDNAYGWRVLPVIFSVLGIAFTYLLALELFKGYFVPGLSAVLLSLDNLYFIHSRLAVLEIFFVTFVLSTIYFLWKYLKSGGGGNLTLLSLSFALAFSTKWTALLFLPMIVLFLFLRGGFRQAVRDYLVLFLITSFIYTLSYLPLIFKTSFWRYLALQQTIFGFWLNFGNKTHYNFSSYFLNHAFSWIFNPGWEYDIRIVSGTKIGVVSAMFNPVIYWTGLLLVVKSLADYKKSGGAGLLILIMPVLSNFFPWLLVRRIQYLYYFLVSLPFLCIIISKHLRDRYSKSLEGRYQVAWFVLTSAAVFIFFYPLISSFPVSKRYISPLSFGELEVTIEENSNVTKTYTLK